MATAKVTNINIQRRTRPVDVRGVSKGVKLTAFPKFSFQFCTVYCVIRDAVRAMRFNVTRDDDNKSNGAGIHTGISDCSLVFLEETFS